MRRGNGARSLSWAFLIDPSFTWRKFLDFCSIFSNPKRGWGWSITTFYVCNWIFMWAENLINTCKILGRELFRLGNFVSSPEQLFFSFACFVFPVDQPCLAVLVAVPALKTEFFCLSPLQGWQSLFLGWRKPCTSTRWSLQRNPLTWKQFPWLQHRSLNRKQVTPRLHGNGLEARLEALGLLLLCWSCYQGQVCT